MKHTHIIVHHTGAEEKDAEQVKRYHLSLGWRDIGYNYVIERYGNVVEGRSLDIPGAHCRAGGMNHKSIGVSVIGNMEEHCMLPDQHEALLGLLWDLVGCYGIPEENILGHREVPGAATACPGRFMDMDVLRRELCQADGNKPDNEVNSNVSTGVKQKTSHLWRVQVGAFSTRASAENYARQLRQKGIDAFVFDGKEISTS